MSSTNDKVSVQLKKEKKESIADFQFPMAKEIWEHNFEILKSGSCTLLMIRHKKGSFLDESYKRLQELADLFRNLIKANHLIQLQNLILQDIDFLNYKKAYLENKISMIQSPFIDLVGQEFFNIIKLPKLISLRFSFLSVQGLISVLNCRTLENLEIFSCDYNKNFNLKSLQEAFLNCPLKFLRIGNYYSDALVQTLSNHKILTHLAIGYNGKVSSKVLKILETSRIPTLELMGYLYDIEGLISLLKANRIKKLHDFPDHSALDPSAISVFYSKEEGKKLCTAFQKNTSLIEIDMDIAFLLHFPDLPRKAEEKIERCLERNLTLKKANENPVVLKSIKEKLYHVLRHLSAEPASVFSDLVASYAQPSGEEIVYLFSSQEAEKLFPEEFLKLREFEFYK